MILAGDVGGTKVELALYRFDKGKLATVQERRYASADFSGLEKIVQKFLHEIGITGAARSSIQAACFGVPGPVRRGRLKLTNLPWELDSRRLAANLKIEHVSLINDLEANGYGIAELPPEMIFSLCHGDASVRGNRALISPGTGLGEAVLVWNGHVHLPMASEGGHSDFAARTDDEIELLRYLREEIEGRVSYERVISGQGLSSIYDFCRDVKRMEEPDWLKERMKVQDKNAVIGELGQAGESEICAKALDMFVSSFGAEAGNLALTVLSVGGMYLGGGIAPKILKKMQDGAFLRAFTDKGRLSEVLEQIPVRIILEPKAALLGAAAYAEAQAANLSGRSERAASLAVSAPEGPR